MHTREMSETEGEFGDWKKSNKPCYKCGGEVYYRIWESDCGGYEDEKYKCKQCGKIWWVEGPDA